MVDGGYSGKPFVDRFKSILNTDVEVAKRNELHTFVVIPKPWVVEPSLLVGEMSTLVEKL